MKLANIVTVPVSFRLMLGQARHFTAQGFECHAIASPGEVAEQYAASEPVTVHAVRMTRRIAPLADVLALLRLIFLLKRIKPDIVQASTPKGGLLGILAARIAGIRVRIYLVRGLPVLTARGLKRRVLQLTERITCFAATDVLCVSRSIRESLELMNISTNRPVTVLADGSSNGVDCGRFKADAGARIKSRHHLGIPADALVIGYVGRLVTEKGVLELAEAWIRLRESFPQAHLLLVGPFEGTDSVPAPVRDLLEGDERVHLTGLQWETPGLYAAMDLFCLPSHREGFPNVVLEAAAMSLPVVATAVSGTVDAIDNGVTGTLVPPNDATALEAALRRYLVDEPLRRVHGLAGRARVLSKFQQETVWCALTTYYLEAHLRRRQAE